MMSSLSPNLQLLTSLAHSRCSVHDLKDSVRGVESTKDRTRDMGVEDTGRVGPCLLAVKVAGKGRKTVGTNCVSTFLILALAGFGGHGESSFNHRPSANGGWVVRGTTGRSYPALLQDENRFLPRPLRGALCFARTSALLSPLRPHPHFLPAPLSAQFQGLFIHFSVTQQ